MCESEFTKQVLEEYKLLRSEIQMYDRQILQALAIVFSATGLIFSQGFAHGNPWIFILPMPILWAFYYYLVDKRFGIWLIASYLVVHVEQHLPGAQWETRIRRWRDRSKKKSKMLVPGKNAIRIEYILFNVLIFTSAILCAWFANPSYWGMLPIAGAICFFVLSTRMYRQLMSEGQSEDSYVEVWRMCSL